MMASRNIHMVAALAMDMLGAQPDAIRVVRYRDDKEPLDDAKPVVNRAPEKRPPSVSRHTGEPHQHSREMARRAKQRMKGLS